LTHLSQIEGIINNNVRGMLNTRHKHKVLQENASFQYWQRHTAKSTTLSAY